ncbi:DUF2312 domain-containing protein [Devosia aurantiaca]|uniref:DUF2312 domain-containing protein n=1 Tax=Devosia aurantiaca TaxID=2714858 RepID=A0A6M1SPW7_9HYPH|nr:DUF2312 domain-containing protein [Devosia aurantiaca]NGP19170.1 DUF2312 domain-containing protein [Devosia aurantiaca]
MSDSNVAQDQIKAYVDRILRMKEEADAIAADVKEIYAEAKANGFDKTQLGNLVTYLRKKDKDADKVAEGEAIFDLYLTAYLGASGKVGIKPATQAHASEKPSPVAALRADPAMAIVDVANLKSQSPVSAGQAVTASEPVVTSPVESEAAEISTPIQPESAPSSVSVETKSDIGSARDTSAMLHPGVVDGPTTIALQAGTVVTAGETAPVSETYRSVEAPSSAAPASKYAEPRVITWETFPPEGVERGAISAAFGWAGQDSAVIADDLEKGRAQPIVKKGNVILDGWARYMAARDMRNFPIRV